MGGLCGNAAGHYEERAVYVLDGLDVGIPSGIDQASRVQEDEPLNPVHELIELRGCCCSMGGRLSHRVFLQAV